MEDIERIPVSFKSKFGGKVYRHIILAVHHIPSDKYGAIGLSRKADLMYVPRQRALWYSRPTPPSLSLPS